MPKLVRTSDGKLGKRLGDNKLAAGCKCDSEAPCTGGYGAPAFNENCGPCTPRCVKVTISDVALCSGCRAFAGSSNGILTNQIRAAIVGDPNGVYCLTGSGANWNGISVVPFIVDQYVASLECELDPLLPDIPPYHSVYTGGSLRLSIVGGKVRLTATWWGGSWEQAIFEGDFVDCATPLTLTRIASQPATCDQIFTPHSYNGGGFNDYDFYDPITTGGTVYVEWCECDCTVGRCDRLYKSVYQCKTDAWSAAFLASAPLCHVVDPGEAYDWTIKDPSHPDWAYKRVIGDETDCTAPCPAVTFPDPPDLDPPARPVSNCYITWYQRIHIVDGVVVCDDVKPYKVECLLGLVKAYDWGCGDLRGNGIDDTSRDFIKLVKYDTECGCGLPPCSPKKTPPALTGLPDFYIEYSVPVVIGEDGQTIVCGPVVASRLLCSATEHDWQCDDDGATATFSKIVKVSGGCGAIPAAPTFTATQFRILWSVDDNCPSESPAWGEPTIVGFDCNVGGGMDSDWVIDGHTATKSTVVTCGGTVTVPDVPEGTPDCDRHCPDDCTDCPETITVEFSSGGNCDPSFNGPFVLSKSGCNYTYSGGGISIGISCNDDTWTLNYVGGPSWEASIVASPADNCPPLGDAGDWTKVTGGVGCLNENLVLVSIG